MGSENKFRTAAELAEAWVCKDVSRLIKRFDYCFYLYKCYSEVVTFGISSGLKCTTLRFCPTLISCPVCVCVQGAPGMTGVVGAQGANGSQVRKTPGLHGNIFHLFNCSFTHPSIPSFICHSIIYQTIHLQNSLPKFFYLIYSLFFHPSKLHLFRSSLIVVVHLYSFLILSTQLCSGKMAPELSLNCQTFFDLKIVYEHIWTRLYSRWYGWKIFSSPLWFCREIRDLQEPLDPQDLRYTNNIT